MSTLTHLGKIFGISVGRFGGWAKSYVQVEYANINNHNNDDLPYFGTAFSW